MKVYNTLSRKVEEFQTLEPNKVKMYVCGPTVYAKAHIGHAMSALVFDFIRRYLEYRGFEVRHVMNFTDVDDKIILRANEKGMDPFELGEMYIREFEEHLKAFNILPATVNPRATREMDQIITMISGLVDKGFAYAKEGDVYFRVTKDSEYGKLSGRRIDDMQSGYRIEVDERKEHPMDFALWKTAKPGEPAWDSPWGKGRPGWHIECSAMNLNHLGEEIDIHGGGNDLVFPHHENEIAQSEALHGVPMAKYWMHNGFITVNEEKMSKSLGNFFLVRDILKKFPADVIRFYLLATHYRSPLDFDDEKLGVAQKGLARLQTAYRLMEEAMNGTLAEHSSAAIRLGAQGFRQGLQALQGKFIEAMNDDLNTALAIAVLFDIAREINTFVAAGVTEQDQKALLEGKRIFSELAGVLGLQLDKKGCDNENGVLVDALMNLIITIRQNARTKKDFQTADEIREKLRQSGIILEDTPQGVRWKPI